MHLEKPEIRKNVCKNIKSKITSRYIKQKNNTKRLQIVLEVEYVQYIYNQFQNLPSTHNLLCRSLLSSPSLSPLVSLPDFLYIEIYYTSLLDILKQNSL